MIAKMAHLCCRPFPIHKRSKCKYCNFPNTGIFALIMSCTYYKLNKGKKSIFIFSSPWAILLQNSSKDLVEFHMKFQIATSHRYQKFLYTHFILATTEDFGMKEVCLAILNSAVSLKHQAAVMKEIFWEENVTLATETKHWPICQQCCR